MTILSPLIAAGLLLTSRGAIDVPEVPVIQSLWEAREPEPPTPRVTPQVAKGPLFLRVWGLRPDESVTVLCDDKELGGPCKGDLDRSQPFHSVLRVPTLSRGKHALRVAYRRGNRRFTKAVEFEVGFPRPPTIDTVYEGKAAAALEGEPSKQWTVVKSNDVKVGVAGVEPGDVVVIYREGENKRSDTASAKRIDLPLKDKLVKGDNRLTAKLERKDADGTWDASGASNVVNVVFSEPPSKQAPLAADKAPDKSPAPAADKPLAPAPALNDAGPPPGPVFCRTPDTFSHRPLVQRVPSLRDDRGATGHGDLIEPPSLEVLAQASGLLLWKFRFDGAANVPIPVFGLQGEPDYEEGAIIYEGMRLVVAQDGRYEVRFNLSTPAMTTVLRLQLTVLDRAGRPVVLTLPPITAGYNDDFHKVFWRQQWFVYHAGHSDALAEAFAGLCSVSRSGTARFGSRPIEINPGGRLDYSTRRAPSSPQ
jgi:hypothetical protein